MQVRVDTSIEIDAPAAVVWAVLLDFDAYGEWNPFVLEIKGDPTPGAHLRVSIRPPGSRGMTFKPQVTTVVDERELCWLGKLMVRGLFDGEHCFQLEKIGPTRVRFVQREAFSGLLVGLFKDSLLKSTRQGFGEMNSALKQRVESRCSGALEAGLRADDAKANLATA